MWWLVYQEYKCFQASHGMGEVRDATTARDFEWSTVMVKHNNTENVRNKKKEIKHKDFFIHVLVVIWKSLSWSR